jgi:UrcA family protein
MKKSILGIATIVAASCGLLGRPAAAQPPTVTVHYAAAALGSQAGVATLYRQLWYAAAAVCGQINGPQPLTELSAYHRCRDKALTAAIVQVGSARLTLYAAQRGTPVVAASLAQASIRSSGR